MKHTHGTVLRIGLAALIGLATITAAPAGEDEPQETSSLPAPGPDDEVGLPKGDQTYDSTSEPQERICGSRKKDSLLRIVGGAETAANEYPWQVLLEVAYDRPTSFSRCGGSLIHPRWVLTAAHCALSADHVMALAFLGMHRTARGGGEPEKGDSDEDRIPVSCQKIFVKRIVKHENYVWQTSENDIALMELLHPAELGDTVQTVCLATDTTNFLNNVGTVTGWGMDAYQVGHVKHLLQEVEVSVVDQDLCRMQYSTLTRDTKITEGMLCAYEEGKDACQGDSGGPFIQETSPGRYVQTGIVSFGLGCAEPNTPGVYTRVAQYTDWIRRTTDYADVCFC